MKKKTDFKILFNIISLAIPVFLFIYLLTSENGLKDLADNISTFKWEWILLGIAFQLLNVLIDAYVLFRIANNYSKKYTFAQSLKTTAVGQFFSVITPGAVGGQPAQLYCMKKQKLDTGIASSSLLQKFVIYQTVMTIYSFACIMNIDVLSNNAAVSLALFGFIAHVVIISAVYLCSFNRKLTSKIIHGGFNLLSKMRLIKNPEKISEKIESQLNFFHESNSRLYKDKKLLMIVLSLTAAQLTCIFIIPYTVYRAFGFFGANPLDIISGQALVTLISSFMPLPGGSGAAEGSFGLLFSNFFTENTIKSAILLWRIITYFMNIIIFAPFANLGKFSETKEILEKI